MFRTRNFLVGSVVFGLLLLALLAWLLYPKSVVAPEIGDAVAIESRTPRAVAVAPERRDYAAKAQSYRQAFLAQSSSTNTLAPAVAGAATSSNNEDITQ